MYPILVTISLLLVAGSSIYMSVYGLMAVFAGNAPVMIKTCKSWLDGTTPVPVKALQAVRAWTHKHKTEVKENDLQNEQK